MDPSRILYPIARWWLGTLRWKVVDPLSERPAVFACWHADLFAAAAFFRDRPVSALVSGSGDGDLLVRVLSGRKLTFLRGSSSAGAVAGAKACLGVLRSGRSVATTWDGPRGPAGVAKPGAAWMAERTGTLLVPLRFSYGFHLRLGDWSRLVLPLPFSRIRIETGPAGVTG